MDKREKIAKLFQEAMFVGRKYDIVKPSYGFADKVLALFDADKRFAEGFKRGQESIKRKNKSGCCCIIDDDDKIISVCGAHQEWFNDNTSKVVVEKKCIICKDGIMGDIGMDGSPVWLKCFDCHGTGKIFRPATWEDLKQGGILRKKE